METQTHDANSLDNVRFQWIILFVGIALLGLKFFAWYLTKSVSILTDALESIVNVIAAAIGLYALHLSARPRDRDHPFGHGKVENISSSIEGVMISTAGLLIIIEAIRNIITPKELSGLDIGLLIVAFAAFVNYAVGTIAVMKGRATRSSALEASGKHLRSDTVSSVGIIVGLLLMLSLQWMGVKALWLDGAIALVFGCVILITGIKVVKKSLDTVMDKADESVVAEVIKTLNEHRHTDWIGIHNLRIAKYGTMLHIEMHVILPNDMTVERQYVEIEEVNHSVVEKFGDSVDLTIMSEPCCRKMCYGCPRECSDRASPFVKTVEWTSEYLCDKGDELGTKDVDA